MSSCMLAREKEEQAPHTFEEQNLSPKEDLMEAMEAVEGTSSYKEVPSYPRYATYTIKSM